MIELSDGRVRFEQCNLTTAKVGDGFLAFCRGCGVTRLFLRVAHRDNILNSGSVGHTFVLENSEVAFENQAKMTVLHPSVKLVGNDFTGNGSIMLGIGDDHDWRSNCEEAEVCAILN